MYYPAWLFSDWSWDRLLNHWGYPWIKNYKSLSFGGAQDTIVNRGSIASLTGIDPFLTSSCALSSSFDLADFWDFSDFSDLSALTFTTGSGQPGKICMPLYVPLSMSGSGSPNRIAILKCHRNKTMGHDGYIWGLHFHPNLKSLVGWAVLITVIPF